ncbi:MAG TPA: DUF4340 domain-containing protein [Rudaea sp.]
MNAKTLYALIGAALLALLGAVLINVAKKPVSESAEQPKALLPGFRSEVNDVKSIALTGADNKVIATLKRGDAGWTIAEKSNYPADLAKVREFLLKLADATLIEQKTSNPKRYAELGVDDIKDKDAKGVLVVLEGQKDPVRLIVGNFNGAGGGGTFVRRDGDAQSWLAKGNLVVEKSTANWEQRDLGDIPASRIKQVTIAQPDGKTLRVSKDQPTDANFKIADVPKGREPSSDFAANSLASALANLRAEDVDAAKDQPPGDKVYKVNYLAFDGLSIDVTAWEKDGKYYAQFAARLDAAQADAKIKADQAKAKADYDAAVANASAKPDDKTKSDAAAKPVDVPQPLAVSDPAKDRDEKLAALTKEVDTLNKTFSGWTFGIASYKFSSFNKSMDEMLKPLDQKKPDGKTPAPGKPAAPGGIPLPPPAAKKG